MSYTKKTLAPREELVRYSSYSWWYVARAAVFSVFLVMIPGLAILAPVPLFLSLLDRWFTEYSVTSSRVLVKRGIIRRRVAELNLRLIEGVDVHQTIWGRIFGIGTVTVRGQGDQRVIFEWCAAPLLVKRKLQAALDNN
jgi:uncharacterized membrane protein YdbT with pleckstrin-like domain